MLYKAPGWDEPESADDGTSGFSAGREAYEAAWDVVDSEADDPVFVSCLRTCKQNLEAQEPFPIRNPQGLGGEHMLHGT